MLYLLYGVGILFIFFWLKSGKSLSHFVTCQRSLSCKQCYEVREMRCHKCQSPTPLLVKQADGSYKPTAGCPGAAKCNCVCHFATGKSHNGAPVSCLKEGGRNICGPFCGCSVCGEQGPFHNMKMEFIASRKEKMPTFAEHEYDVVFLGGGAAALMNAWLLLLHCGPLIRIAMIEPRSPDRKNEKRDLKVGESTVWTSATFIARDLGLHDYMLENHPLKFGLFYHWPKKADQTNDMEDYYSAQDIGYPKLPSFQIHRAKFERDLLKLCQTRGLTLYEGFATIDNEKLVNDDNKMHEIPVTLMKDGVTTGGNVSVKGRHVVDCSARAFLLGKALGSITRGPSPKLFNIDNASVWVRVKNCSYANMLHGTESAALVNRTFNSLFYATNHFMGVGHWLWVIPIEERGEREISIGVSFHKKHFTMEQFDTVEKFYSFLKANHRILYDICASSDLVDFQVMNRLAHFSDQVLTPRNLYIVGEATYNADPFYSTGLVVVSQQVPAVSTVILGKLSGRRPLTEMNALADAYNKGVVAVARSHMRLITQHAEHLGNASVMSWRILMEISSSTVRIAYLNLWTQCPKFMLNIHNNLKKAEWVMFSLYDQLTEINKSGKNIGFPDHHTGGTLPVLNIDHSPFDCVLVGEDELNWISPGTTEFKRVNIHRVGARLQKRWMLMFITLLYRGFGIGRIFTPNNLSLLGYMFTGMLRSHWNAFLHDRALRAAKISPNSERTLIQQTFGSYVPPMKAQEWDSTSEAVTKSKFEKGGVAMF